MVEQVIALHIRWFSRPEYVRGTQLDLQKFLANNADAIDCLISIAHKVIPSEKHENNFGVIRATEVITQVGFMNIKEAVRYKLSHSDQDVINLLQELNACADIGGRHLTWLDAKHSMAKVQHADIMISLEPTKL